MKLVGKIILVLMLGFASRAWAVSWVSASHTICLQTTASTGVACTLAAATTNGNTVVVSMGLKTPTRTLTNMQGSVTNAFFMQNTPVTPNGSSNGSVLAVCFQCPSITTVTPTLSGTSIYALTVEEYASVGSLGAWASATGSSTTPSVSLTTIDNNNWIVAAFSNLGNAGVITANTGNLRDAGRTGTTSSFSGIGACDNTVAVAGSVTCSGTMTSGAWTAVGLELRTGSSAPACASPCPALYQYAQWGSNTGGVPEAPNMHQSLPKATGANNLLVCGTGFDNTDGSHAVAFSSFTIDGTSFTAGPTSNDGTRVFGLYYIAGIAAGKQNLDFELTNTTYDIQIWCAEFYNVATSTPLDGTATSASGLTPSPIQPGSITTTVDNDLIFVAGLNDATLSAAHYVASYAAAVSPGNGSNNLTLLGDTRRFGPFAYFINQQTHGAINPPMYIDQSTKDTWGIAAIAFKAASAGTAPSGEYIAREIVEIPSTTTYRIDLPCSGNLRVDLGSTQPSQAKINSVVDASGNSDSCLGTCSGASGPQILHVDNAACNNSNYRQATVTMSNVSVVDPIHMYDIVGAATSPLDTLVTTSTPGATASGGLVTSGSQNQAHYAVSSVACTNSANSNSALNFIPSFANGIAFIVENNGQGPECGASSTGNVPDMAWFGGEDDACCGTLDSSSGYGHIQYNSTSTWTYTFNWANCLADTPNTGCASGTGPGNAPGSSYWSSIALFKAPGTSNANPPVLVIEP